MQSVVQFKCDDVRGGWTCYLDEGGVVACTELAAVLHDAVQRVHDRSLPWTNSLKQNAATPNMT